MVFQSLNEMMLTIIAWQFYELLWVGLVETGLIFIPFLMWLYKDSIEEYRGRGTTDGAISSLRKFPLDIIITMIVVGLFYTPVLTKTVDKLEVREALNVANESEEETLSEDGKARSVEAESQVRKEIRDMTGGAFKVPILFDYFGSMAKGFSSYLIEGLPEVVDVRMLQTFVFGAAIRDPALYKEVRRFTNECYVPAFNKYDSTYGDRPTEEMQKIMSEVEDDLGWIGSEILSSTESLYAKCSGACPNGDGFRSRTSVGHIEYDERRDSGPGRPSDGKAYPYCSQWWLEEDAGLRDRIFDYIDEVDSDSDSAGFWNLGLGSGAISWGDRLGLLFNKIPGVSEKTAFRKENMIMRHFLRNTHAIASAPTPYKSKEGGFLDFLKGALGLLSASTKQVEVQTMVHVVKLSLPIIQSLLMFTLIITLPLFAIASRFSLEKVWIPIVGLFFINLLSAWWVLVTYVDNKILPIMGLDRVWASAFHYGQVGGLDQAIYIQIWNMVVAGLYIGLPIVAAGFLSAAGASMGITSNVAGTGAMNAGGESARNTGKDAGGQASGKVRGATKGGVKGAAGGMKSAIKSKK